MAEPGAGPPVDRRGARAAARGVPGRHDLQDPVPREPGSDRARAHAVGLPQVLRRRRRAAAGDPARAAREVPAAAGHQGPHRLRQIDDDATPTPPPRRDARRAADQPAAGRQAPGGRPPAPARRRRRRSARRAAPPHRPAGAAATPAAAARPPAARGARQPRRAVRDGVGRRATSWPQLEDYGVVPKRAGAGELYGDEAVEIAAAAGGFLRAGVDARHLRAWRTSVEREAGLYEQLILPCCASATRRRAAQAADAPRRARRARRPAAGGDDARARCASTSE